MKLVNEGRPWTSSSQLELEESLRLSELNKNSELLIHASYCVPQHPEMPCPGEDKFISYRNAYSGESFIVHMITLFKPNVSAGALTVSSAQTVQGEENAGY